MTYSRKSNGWVLKTRPQGIIMIIASHLSNQRGPTRLQAWTDYRGWRTERLYHQDCFLLCKKMPIREFWGINRPPLTVQFEDFPPNFLSLPADHYPFSRLYFFLVAFANIGGRGHSYLVAFHKEKTRVLRSWPCWSAKQNVPSRKL